VPVGHRAGVTTHTMVAPVLPGAEGLVDPLRGRVDYVFVDRMNYHYADRVCREHDLQDTLSDDFFRRATRDLRTL